MKPDHATIEINPSIEKEMHSANAPLRILLLVHSLRRGGAERVLLEIALGLRARGHRVEVVAWLDVDEYVEECYRSVPRHFLMRKEEYRWPLSVPQTADRLRALSQKFQPDVIEIHTPTVAWVAAWAKLQIPCIHVVQGYGAITRSGSFKDWLMRQGDRLAHRFLNARFIVPAPPMAEVSAGHFAVDFSRFDCVPNCVDVLSFTPRPKLPDEVPSIMMLGTLSHHKGQQWGVKAIAFMQRYFPNVKLLVVGEGTYRPELETLIRDLELEERVELTGRRRDAFEMLADSHVFWHLSESEGLPMVVLEAMASGLPVVGFDVRGTRDVIVDGETGYLVPFGDIEMVVQKTVALLNNEFLYQKMSRNAREHVAGRFSLECMIVGHESVLHSAKTDVR